MRFLRALPNRHPASRLLPRDRRLSAWGAGALLLFSMGVTGNAMATCRFDSGSGSQTPGPHPYNALPRTATMNKVAMGADLTWLEIAAPARSTVWNCWDTISYSGAVTSTSLKIWDAAKGIYESGIPGVGIQFKMNGYSNSTARYVPFSINFTSGSRYVGLPNYLRVHFVRIGAGVGRGEVPPFDVELTFKINTSPESVVIMRGTGLTTHLNHTVYYTSCHNATTDPVVPMGRPTIATVKQNKAPVMPFALDIQCEGMNPLTKPPVKVYFKGNSPGAGQLHLDNAGQAGVAKGVMVALTASDGRTPLPFTQAGALPLRHTSTAVNAENYRFEGQARYAPSGSEEGKAGKANATLSYILEYN